MLALVHAPSAPARLELRETDEPAPRPDEALVQMRAASLNRGEVRRLGGRPEGFNPGWDVAGVVAAEATDGSGPPAGTRVVGLVSSGAWAQRVAVPTVALAPLPDEVSFAAASTLPVAGLTALKGLGLGGMLLGKRVLVTGASGGVGRFAIQLARRSGAHVTGVVGSAGRAEGLEELGADEIEIGFEPEGPGFDLILESAGGPSLAAALQRVLAGGVVVTLGDSSGEPVTLDSASRYYGRAPGSSVYAFMVFNELARSQSGTRDLASLAAEVAAGRLDPQIALETSWREPEEAVGALMERRVPGKAVLHVD